MPVDFATLQHQAHGQVNAYRHHLDQVQQRLHAAQAALETWASRASDLTGLVEQAFAQDPRWRSAAPAHEPLEATYPAPTLPAEVVLLAADGSQINPDPHGPVYFALVNLGLVAMDRHHTPVALVRTHLLLNELYEAQGSLGESAIALQRDLRERQGLAWAAALVRGAEPVRAEMEQAFPALAQDPMGSNAAQHLALQAMHRPGAPLITLTDGPLELWEQGPDEAYRRYRERYLNALSTLQRLEALAVGYVDHPRADLVIRMLELTLREEAAPREAASALELTSRPWAGVRDRDLWGRFLPPGHRSPLFRIRAHSLDPYPDDLVPHFFYLNLSADPQRPTLARVEIPAWVARRPEQVGWIHAVLLWQAHIIPGRRYPYLLHRAHETAVVTQEDRRQVTWLLQRALLSEGLPPDARSAKRQLKDAPQRTRFRL